jgi:hypothetical protein
MLFVSWGMTGMGIRFLGKGMKITGRGGKGRGGIGIIFLFFSKGHECLWGCLNWDLFNLIDLYDGWRVSYGRHVKITVQTMTESETHGRASLRAMPCLTPRVPLGTICW